MPYLSDGTLTTDSREVAIDTTWDTQTDWEAYQSINGVSINSGVLELAQTTIDDFEDGDIAEYTGDTGSYTVTSTNPIEGSNMLVGTAPSGGGVIIRSNSGLPVYPSSGDTFTWKFRATAGDQLQAFLFGAQSGSSGLSNSYRVETNYDAANFGVYDADGALAQTGVTLSTDTVYRAEVTWDSPDISATLYQDSDGSQVSSVSASDSTFTSGGIGWRSYAFTSSGDIHHDIARII